MKIKITTQNSKIIGLASYKRLSNFFGEEGRFFAEFDNHFDEPISIRMADLKAIACAVFYEDCKVKRPLPSWERQINVTVKVHDLSFWQRDDVLQSLKEVLDFTGDKWCFDFSLSSSRPPTHQPRFAMNLDPMGARVFLATEGADSFPGINIRLAMNSEQRFLGVNAISHPVRAARLSFLLKNMDKSPLVQLSMVQVPTQRDNYAGRRGEEGTQRSRTFLLLVIASMFAYATGDKTVEIYENGIEAFNFPLMPCQNPSTFSQAMNPLMIASMKKFVSLVSGQEIIFRMPFLFHTKSMILREALPLMGEGQLGRTVSCIRFPSHREGTPPCGVCSGWYTAPDFVRRRRIG